MITICNNSITATTVASNILTSNFMPHIAAADYCWDLLIAIRVDYIIRCFLHMLWPRDFLGKCWRHIQSNTYCCYCWVLFMADYHAALDLYALAHIIMLLLLVPYYDTFAGHVILRKCWWHIQSNITVAAAGNWRCHYHDLNTWCLHIIKSHFSSWILYHCWWALAVPQELCYIWGILRRLIPIFLADHHCRQRGCGC